MDITRPKKVELDQSRPLHELLADANRGVEEAVWTLVHRYTPQLRRILASRLNSHIQARVGVSDVVQATWASFLLDESDLTRFQSEEELAAYIAGIAVNKLKMLHRTHLRTQTRDCRREVQVERSTLDGAPQQQPSASEVFIFRESWNAFLQSQPEHYRRIVQLRIDGLTYAQIAEALRLNERTVRRVLDKLVQEVL